MNTKPPGSLLLDAPWPRTLTPPEQAQLVYVRDSAVGLCCELLSSGASFVPFGLGTTPDGHIRMVGGPLFMPDAVENPGFYVLNGLVASAAELVAIAFADDVGGDASPFLRILCEHADAGAFHVSIPWSRRADGSIARDRPIIETTRPAVFARF